MDRFYDGIGSVLVEAYDAFYAAETGPVAGDTAFYRGLAQDAGGPTLEVACGTGRITLALAAAGLTITGVDLSDGMLDCARAKAAALPEPARQRLTLIRQDMAELDLGSRYGFAFVPFRSFQHVPTTELQQQTLAAIHRHLVPGGRLALHLFDPRFDRLVDGADPPRDHAGTDPLTGRRYTAQVLETRLDHLAQTRHDLWRYAELGPDGAVLRQETRLMSLRWTHRWELHHLLARCGFTVEAEYSDFARSPPAYGKELVVVARAAEGRRSRSTDPQ